MKGLSPRVRGNHARLTMPLDFRGSIPASAGEPVARLERAEKPRVYPRECGGTYAAWHGGAADVGLSPRVRGNPGNWYTVGETGGSIPASAGEPPSPRTKTRFARVYPRECGGTTWDDDFNQQSWGLSPRVRGNLGPKLVERVPVGSIPASAGEPAG